MRSPEVQADATLFPADDWLQLTSDVRASRLSRLATRARQAETQNRLVAKGLQRLLVSEVLLRRAPVTLFEADALRTEQAEAARCIANLAFQQSNKPAVVEAGGLDALEGLLSAELQCARAGAPLGDAAAALILEATAAIANLASSSEVRVRCAEATCPVPVLLLEVIELWRGARANRRRRRSGVVTAPGTGPSLYSAASEATRGLKNLACDPITHARLLGAGALESLQQAPPPPPPPLPPPPLPPPLPLPPPPPSPRNASLSSTAHLPRTAPPRPHPPPLGTAQCFNNVRAPASSAHRREPAMRLRPLPSPLAPRAGPRRRAAAADGRGRHLGRRAASRGGRGGAGDIVVPG